MISKGFLNSNFLWHTNMKHWHVRTWYYFLEDKTGFLLFPWELINVNCSFQPWPSWLLATGPGKHCNHMGCRHPPKGYVDFTSFSISWTCSGIYLYPYHSMPPSPIGWSPDRFLSGCLLLLPCSPVHIVLKMIFAKCKSDHVTAHCLYIPHPHTQCSVASSWSDDRQKAL